MHDFVLTNGHIIDPANNIDMVGDVIVKDGKIIHVGVKQDVSSECECIDVSEKLVVPGLIDLQVHFRDPGFPEKETIETGLKSALAGGVTSVVTMPNTDPVTDAGKTVEYQLKKAKDLHLGNLFVAGAITKGQNGEELADMENMKQSGIVGITDDGSDVQNKDLLRKAMIKAKELDLVVMPHSEAKDLSDGGVVHQGNISQKLNLKGVPAEAEDEAVRQNIAVAEEAGVKLHLLHVSTKQAIQYVREALQRGVQVTAETCPQYFCLTDEICDGMNTYGKMYPPIRSESHRQAVIEGLQDGTLSIISTDHAPHTKEEKEITFQEAAWGSVGLETSFALGYTSLVQKGLLELKDVIAKMTTFPAKVIDIPKGTLSLGADADIAIFDLQKQWTVRVDDMETKGGNSVFEGMELQGKVERVFVGGEEKMRDGKMLP